MNPTPTRVLVLGGYGLFGQRISTRLAQDPAFEVVVAGRHAQQAEALLQTFDPSCRARCLALRMDTTEAGFNESLLQLQPKIVIDAAGPFQTREMRVPLAALEAGAHCIDLADGRDYVARIKGLDAFAKTKDLRVITGASSVPGISAAVVAEFAPKLAQLLSVEAAISPGNHTPRGRATTEAILGYVGQPYSILKAGQITTAHGWQSLKKLYFEDIGSRWFARCEVPDLDLLPELYPSLRTCDFRAGLELKRMHFGLWLASWAVRFGAIKTMSRFARPLIKLSEAWQTLGSDTGVMHVALTGVDVRGMNQSLQWTITARNGDGPEIPATPAVVLAQKLARGEITGGGASACSGFFKLDEILASLEPFEIETQSW